MPVSIEEDRRIRQEAMAWLTIRTNDGRDPISTADLSDFTVDGQPFLLKDRQQGIRKPAGFRAALSIQTVYRADGQNRPYADDVGPDGLLRYKWRGTDPDLYVNVALRQAMALRLPLIWFSGVGVALWQPIFPVYILAEEPEQHQFVVDPDVARTLAPTGSIVEEHLRRYIIAETKRRLHQPVFRATVMRAYGSRCALCSLRHGEPGRWAVHRPSRSRAKSRRQPTAAGLANPRGRGMTCWQFALPTSVCGARRGSSGSLGY